MAAVPVLVVTTGAETRQFTADELLAWRDAATLAVPHDVAYGRATSYRAVPLPHLGDRLEVTIALRWRSLVTQHRRAARRHEITATSG
jgi:hypothetical protein